MTSGGAVYGHHVGGGPATILFTPPGGSGLTTLGLSEDGVDIESEFFEREIKGDQMGGKDGAPVDILLLGQIDTITMEIVDFTAAAMQQVLGSRGTYGVPGTPGRLLLAGNLYLRLLINTPNNPLNYPYAWLTNPGPSFNLATVETHMKLTFKALVPSVGGTLYNSANS